MSAPTWLCGYLEAGQQGEPCREPREEGLIWCAKHKNPAYSVCSCGRNAVRLCQDCLATGSHRALCPDCSHLAAGLHGSPVAASETPFSLGEPQGAGVPETVEQVWTEFVEAAVLAGRASRNAGDGEWETAERVVKALATTSLMGFMASTGRKVSQLNEREN